MLLKRRICQENMPPWTAQIRHGKHKNEKLFVVCYSLAKESSAENGIIFRPNGKA